MLFIILLLSLLNSNLLFSMYTPKVSSFALVNHNNLAEEKPTQGTPRSQTCKVINTSPGSSKALSFEINHYTKQAKPVERCLSFSDDEITSDEEQEKFQKIVESSKQKRAKEKTSNNFDASNSTPQRPPLTSPILANSQMLEKSFRKEPIDQKTDNKKIVIFDKLEDPAILEQIQNIFLNENHHILGHDLEITDVFPRDYENCSPEDIMEHLNNRYNFTCIYNQGEITGVLIHIDFFDSSKGYKKSAIQMYLDNNEEFNSKDFVQVLSKFEDVCKKKDFQELSINLYNPKQRDFFKKKLGYSIEGILGELSKKI